MFDFHSIAVPDEIGFGCCGSQSIPSMLLFAEYACDYCCLFKPLLSFLCSIGFGFLLCLFADVGHHSTLFSLTEILE
jgi:hypothetical protein